MYDIDLCFNSKDDQSAYRLLSSIPVFISNCPHSLRQIPCDQHMEKCLELANVIYWKVPD